MNIDTIMQDLQNNANPSRKKTLIKAGATENTYGVLIGYLRKYANKIGINHDLAHQLWQTKNTDARLLAVMLFDSNRFELEDVVSLLKDESFDQIIDDFMFRVGINIKNQQLLFKLLIEQKSDMLNRAAWVVQVEFVKSKQLDSKEIIELIKQIETQLVSSSKHTQWMMNRCFAQIGITYDAFRTEVLELATQLGVYKHMKVAPNCTSAYVPNWINAVVK
jgi:3-methyladenine DNA glycosylase AlkD